MKESAKGRFFENDFNTFEAFWKKLYLHFFEHFLPQNVSSRNSQALLETVPEARQY